MGTTGVFYHDLTLGLAEPIEISWKNLGKLGIPRLNSKLKYSDSFSHYSNLLEFKMTDDYQEAMKSLYNVLYGSLESRILCIPNQKENRNPRLAVLFSGGLDCTIIAGIAHSILPCNESIDLLNVAFENPRKANSSFDVPDRITGRRSYQELSANFPERTWNFVEINVSFTEYMNAKPRILRLMCPCSSVMDLSIAMALWFASSGNGIKFRSNL